MQKFAPIFKGKNIVIPFAQPVILLGTKEDKNYGFIFTHNEQYYYIFATLQQGVINNNLPKFLDETSKEILIDSVNQYCDQSRQGLQDNIFISSRSKSVQ
ncbi:MAG: hypothetical protein V4565_06075 [Bacteroidota bacterium]